jgi:hypothetical protein
VPLPFDIGIVPTRGQAAFISFLLVLNFILSVVGYELAFPDVWHKTKSDEWMGYFANRVGVLSFANIPAIILYSSRNNPHIGLTGWSYSTFLLCHRWLAYVSIFQALIHTVIYFIEHIHLLPKKFGEA